MTTALMWALIGGAATLGFILGLWLRPFLLPKTLPISEIRKTLAAAVNREELEQQRKMNRIDVQHSGRRTTRADGGPHAVVYRMRKRRNVTREPIDGS